MSRFLRLLPMNLSISAPSSMLDLLGRVLRSLPEHPSVGHVPELVVAKRAVGPMAAAVIALAAAPPGPVVAQDADFHERATELAGAYELESDDHLIIVPHPSLGLLSLFHLETGLARPLEPVADPAGDAAAAVDPTGDATVASETYVYGWQQNRWNRLSTLRWEGFDSDAVDEAAAFLDDHYFPLMHGEITWAEYESAQSELEGRPWFDWMREMFGTWESEAEVRAYAGRERDNEPEEDFARVSVPTLGLFFEHDESSPPETPWIFLRGRARGPNPGVTVRVFANTTHEAFVAEEFPTEAGQSRIERLEPAVFGELRRWVGDIVEEPAGSGPDVSAARDGAPPSK